MRLWVDDIRVPPEGWVWAKTSQEAIDAYQSWLYSSSDRYFEAIAFDHDLGEDDDSRRVLNYIVERDIWPDHIYFLTSNPVGRQWLEGTARSYAPETTTIHAGQATA